MKYKEWVLIQKQLSYGKLRLKKPQHVRSNNLWCALSPPRLTPIFHPGKGPCFIFRMKIRTVQMSDSVTFVTEKRQNIKSKLNGKSFSLPPKLFEQETISFTVKSCSNQFYCLLCNKSKMNTALRWKLHQHFLQFHHLHGSWFYSNINKLLMNYNSQRTCLEVHENVII